nr:MAG TPA: hypothetical protein [Caudoviricetes sp.]
MSQISQVDSNHYLHILYNQPLEYHIGNIRLPLVNQYENRYRNSISLNHF